jgi:hypothetical protein
MQGLSIGYKPSRRPTRAAPAGSRSSALKEFSPVTFPMNELASPPSRPPATSSGSPSDASTRSAASCGRAQPARHVHRTGSATSPPTATARSSRATTTTRGLGRPVHRRRRRRRRRSRPFSDWIEAEQVWVAEPTRTIRRPRSSGCSRRPIAIADDMSAGRPLTTKTRAALADTQTRFPHSSTRRSRPTGHSDRRRRKPRSKRSSRHSPLCAT